MLCSLGTVQEPPQLRQRTAVAVGSLVLSLLIPRHPEAGNESRIGAWFRPLKSDKQAPV